MASDGFSWWIARLRHTLELVDLVRLDHFRGFASYWEVPAEAETAVHGRWQPGPGRPFFDAVRSALGALPLVAEDLGEITPDVVALRMELGIPGMAILHFAFSPEPRSTFIPYALDRNMVIYTGTHDNNTTVGWYLEDAPDAEKDLVRRYAGSSGQRDSLGPDPPRPGLCCRYGHRAASGSCGSRRRLPNEHSSGWRGQLAFPDSAQHAR